MQHRAYQYMGAHKELNAAGEVCTVFRVWAPRARRVWVYGDFCNWNLNEAWGMESRSDGIWEAHLPELPEYSCYKYHIQTADGSYVDKSDPYGFHMETRPATASRIYTLDGYEWGDGAYLEARSKRNPYQSPMSIYEVHLSSWRRYPDGNTYSYDKLCEELVPYVKEMGYTHVEMMPVSEYPYDPSWGYQVLGYYAPTSRYGTPKGLMHLIDTFHQNGIGVILDWVPAHFPKDTTGLSNFDGQPLYEYEDPRKGEHKSWGTKVFDYTKPQVRDFLISNAMYWLDMYHFDGLRVDAVASMLYLDYDREAGQWIPNQYGGNANLEAVSFLQELNTCIFAEHPDALMVAEESTAWAKVTAPVYDGGLGFNFKWNMGWMHDVLSYISEDPYFRKDHHNNLTFPLSYAFSENFVLPLSHDEVVYGKRSLLSRNPGSYEQKFAGLKCLYGYMYASPGKKLLFMGGEFGQFIEWDYQKELDWNLLEYDSHRLLRDFVRDLNKLYTGNKAFYEQDDSWDGFRWLNCDDNNNNILSFYRTDKAGKHIICVLNFAPVRREGYRIGAPDAGSYRQILCSDDFRYGGHGDVCADLLRTDNEIAWQGQEQSLVLDIAPMSVSFYQCVRRKNK